MINKYVIPNRYGFSRYKDISNFAFREYSNKLTDKALDTVLADFTEEQQDAILTLFGYTLAYAQRLDILANPVHAEQAKQARQEANKLYKELSINDNLLFHISFSLGKEVTGKKKSLRIKSNLILRELLHKIKPIIEEQANKETAVVGNERNSYRKKLLQSLVPLFKYIENETHFKEQTKIDIAEWILNLINPVIIQKYRNLDIDLIDCIEMLIDYRTETLHEKYEMELV